MTVAVSIALLVVTCALGLLVSLLAARLAALDERVTLLERSRRIDFYQATYSQPAAEVFSPPIEGLGRPDPISEAVRRVVDAH